MIITEILRPDFLLRNALYAGVIAGIVCPWIGVYFLLRRMIFLGIALPQVSSAGIALAFLLHNLGVHILPHSTDETWMALGGSISLTFAALVTLTVFSRQHAQTEGRLGTMYIVAGALSILFVAADPRGEAHVMSLFKGDIVTVSGDAFALMAWVYAAVCLLLIAFHRELVLVSYDAEMAVALGRVVYLWNGVLYLIVGTAISVGVMTVGPMVVFAFLLLPPLAATRLVSGVVPLCAVSSLVGVASAFIGFCVAYRYDLPLGPTDVVVAYAFLLASSAISLLRDSYGAREPEGSEIRASV